jgi:hypothetical protein
LYKKINPNPTGKPPMAGPIQCTRGYEVQAKMNKPIGINQQETIMGINRVSGDGLPPAAADSFR